MPSTNIKMIQFKKTSRKYHHLSAINVRTICDISMNKRISSILNNINMSLIISFGFMFKNVQHQIKDVK